MATRDSLDHLLGLARAARQTGRKAEVFFTGEGVLLTQDPRFSGLPELGKVKVCEVGYIANELRGQPVAGLVDKDFVTQARNAEMVEECDRPLKVAPVGNPAMPIPVPNAVGAIPGMTAMATLMMKRMMKSGNVPTVPELLQTAKDMGVKLLGCQMTMDVMGVQRDDLIDAVDDTVGAAAFVAEALDADISMFI